MEYQVSPNTRFGGTAHNGDIAVAPRRLVEVFGDPLLNDGDVESFGSYVFSSAEGKVFTVYYRSYDVERKEIQRQRLSFWQQEQELEFHIGAKRVEDVVLFKVWLVQRLATNAG